MANPCEDCPEILKTRFQIDSLELCIQKQNVKINVAAREKMIEKLGFV